MRIESRGAQPFAELKWTFDFRPLQCPYCKGDAGCEPELVRCSACRTQYHRECWFENQGCSVFGCNGSMMKIRGFSIRIPYLGTHLRIFEEPKWLMFLRFIVFGFYPLTILTRTEGLSFSFSDVFLITWALLFVLSLPVLFIVEIACWWMVYEDPTLQERFGKEKNHLISLAIYGSTIGFLLLSIFL